MYQCMLNHIDDVFISDMNWCPQALFAAEQIARFVLLLLLGVKQTSHVCFSEVTVAVKKHLFST